MRSPTHLLLLLLSSAILASLEIVRVDAADPVVDAAINVKTRESMRSPPKGMRSSDFFARTRGLERTGVVVGPTARYFAQRQDHFDASNDRTWMQAYYVNDTFFDPSNPSAPVFLCVGGEGPPLDGSAVVSSVHCNVAVELLQETGALMLALEHRYYGCHNASACPYRKGKEPINLKYLSSRQAVEDVASFHAHVTGTYFPHASREDHRWIAFGGSYPGMLASFVRIEHPELIHASIASSAPVEAKVDMVEYNDVAAAAYALASVGGSEACRDAIARGHARVSALLRTEDGRSELKKLFELDDASALDTHQGQLNFAGYGVADFPAQSNDPSCDAPACDVRSICAVMTRNDTDPLHLLAEVRSMQGFKLETVSTDDADLYWPYQTCTEFGFYQTCEVGSGCFFVQGLDLLRDQVDFCSSAFNISLAHVEASVRATNAHYGGRDPNATRIMYPNGNVDPWSGLSVLKSPDPKALPVLMVDGASHHFWTHPSKATDQPSVVRAREIIRKQVRDWLASSKRTSAL